MLTQISWTNHLAILSQCKTGEERQFYLFQSAQEHYSSRELERQIDSGLFERTRLATAQLPEPVKQLPQQAADVFRDSYVFEFLDLPDRHTEADLQQALIKNLSKFLLETGRTFTLAGENVRIQVGNQDFYIDLLLYHRSLQCLVAVELKVTKFKPEHIGQLNFYLEALDRDYRLAHENPSIGLLLCASKDSQVVEYALSLFPFLDSLHTSLTLTWQGLTEKIMYECQFNHRQFMTVAKPSELHEQFIQLGQTNSDGLLEVQVLIRLSMKPLLKHPNGTGALVAFRYIDGYYHLSDDWTSIKIAHRSDEQLSLNESNQLIKDIQTHLLFALANEHPSVIDPKSFHNTNND